MAINCQFLKTLWREEYVTLGCVPCSYFPFIITLKMSWKRITEKKWEPYKCTIRSGFHVDFKLDINVIIQAELLSRRIQTNARKLIKSASIKCVSSYWKSTFTKNRPEIVLQSSHQLYGPFTLKLNHYNPVPVSISHSLGFKLTFQSVQTKTKSQKFSFSIHFSFF